MHQRAAERIKGGHTNNTFGSKQSQNMIAPAICCGFGCTTEKNQNPKMRAEHTLTHTEGGSTPPPCLARLKSGETTAWGSYAWTRLSLCMTQRHTRNPRGSNHNLIGMAQPLCAGMRRDVGSPHCQTQACA